MLRQAISDYTRALSLDPDNAYAFYNRGISKDRSGEYAGAIQDFTKVGHWCAGAGMQARASQCGRKAWADTHSMAH